MFFATFGLFKIFNRILERTITMNEIKSMSDFDALFAKPFKAGKLLYSLNYLTLSNDLLKSGHKQFAADGEETSYQCLPEFPCGEAGCRSTFRTVRDYEIHCQSVHRLVCSECKKCFPTYNMLDVHIQEKHDSYHQAAKARNLAKFQCIVEGCSQIYSSGEERDVHIIEYHNFPSNFRFQSLKSEAEPEGMEVSLEDELVAPEPQKPRRKLPRNVCFGRGSARAFSHASRQRSNKDISMKELADAL